MNEKIESLAFEKEFDALSPMERAMVLTEMPQEEFERLRLVLLTVRELDASAAPPSRLRAQLLNKMATQPRIDFVGRALAARVSLWKAAAVLIFVAALMWGLNKEQIQEKIETKIQVHTDTVWQEKIRWREKVVWRERVIFKEKPNAGPMATSPELLGPQHLEIQIPQPEFTPPHVGTSLGDTPELMGFFTQGDK